MEKYLQRTKEPEQCDSVESTSASQLSNAGNLPGDGSPWRRGTRTYEEDERPGSSSHSFFSLSSKRQTQQQQHVSPVSKRCPETRISGFENTLSVLGTGTGLYTTGSAKVTATGAEC